LPTEKADAPKSIAETLSRSAKASQVLVKFDDRLASLRLAFSSDEQDDARKFREHAAAAPTHFAGDEGSIGTETNHELKRRKIDGAKICHSGHSKLLQCCA
jgi:hypothetical protein